MMAAHDSEYWARSVERRISGPEYTLEQFEADICRIATVYPRQPVLPLFLEAIELRDAVFRLLEENRHPRQSRDLYLIAGLLCGVLSNASFDLGQIHAAETQARTAFLCAEFAGHNPLRAWLRGTQSMIAYWDNRLTDAIEYANDGLTYAPDTGTTRLRLASHQARACGRMGPAHTRTAADALRRVVEARERLHGQDEPGGMFAFPEEKALYCVSSTHLWLGRKTGYQKAETAARHSVELYEQPPPEQRRLGELCHAKLDLATARLAQGFLDGASEQIHGVLAIMAVRRIDSVLRRLNQFAAFLDRPQIRTSGLAGHLRDEVTAFVRKTLTTLPLRENS